MTNTTPPDSPPTTDPQPLLKSGVLYLAHDRFVCATVTCAGMSALYSGYTIGGARVTKVTAADKRAWPADLGPMKCECGKVTA